ncbi:hypothetical protein [Mesorhizobium sp.]|uniref:hypothetical protein n=1 Tax=Mesorhizobium sp. TaxID=1871066 RepID=UPI0012066097|nr:hypothetical protein [Mesorhizobium sp.]TIO08718.1 MAG: hypothetical protein E5X88_11880 [Mesorhizobium sp.]TIO36237.1 MAG: hypothetical protein E5X89_05505 [Mesorhizobium sp.]
MNKYVAAALTIAIAIGPASALDVGLGGNVGGVGVSAGASVGSTGASVAGGASIGGVGGASLGGSVSAGSGSLGAGLGVSGNLGDSAVGSGQAASGSAGITPAIAKAKAARLSAVLPRVLWPSENGRKELAPITKGYPLGFLAPLKAKPGTPPAVVRACRTAIASAATPLGAVRVHAVSAGPLRQQRRGALMARIEVRIHYARQGGIEVRQARVGCRLDAAGRVTAVT